MTGLLAVLLAVPGISAGHAQSATPFDSWLSALRQDARQRGISEVTLDRALTGLRPNPKVVELDRRQPEFTQTFWTYLDKRVTKKRIERGRQMLKKHRRLLEEIYRAYGVQPRFLVAFWGLESNFGDYQGSFNVIQSLATLAFDPRRARFFRTQLLDALEILDEGHTEPERMLGSWAGAMGHVQFIPSTFARYAVDHDNDGRRDIWTSLPDAFASAANYLKSVGWRGDQIWGREVILPAGFDWDQSGLEVQRPVTAWRRMGITRSNGRALPATQIAASVVLPAGHRGPAFLVYRNYRSIMIWNRSILYALAVGHLSDRIAGLGPIRAARVADDRALSRAEIEEMQEHLTTLGFNAGRADGVPGPRTRRAVRAYQRVSGLPADGYASVELLRNLRAAATAPTKPKGVN